MPRDCCSGSWSGSESESEGMFVGALLVGVSKKEGVVVVVVVMEKGRR